MSAPARAQVSAPIQVNLSDYYRVGAMLAVFGLGLAIVTRITPTTVPSPVRLIAPIEALAGLTALVWLVMLVVRNATIIRGITRPEYFHDYVTANPPEWVERPARTFNNLCQVPILFYVICLLMMITGRVDEAQITLAWVYVGTRVVHAIIYIGWNYVPYRFAAWNASCLSLAVIWARFAF
jgi:hypothetical protein